jgi:hypothetical protein
LVSGSRNCRYLIQRPIFSARLVSSLSTAALSKDECVWGRWNHYQVSLVDDDIDGQRISARHLRQLALVMKILNSANVEGDGRTGWVGGLFAKNGCHH